LRDLLLVMTTEASLTQVDETGFAIINNVYTDAEIGDIIYAINNAPSNSNTFRRTEDLFAIRQFIKGIPAVAPIIFNENLKSIVTRLFGDGYFVTKSIYFDKPAQSNWFVAYHQDLTISVDKKQEIDGFGPWTVKQDQFAVQPPVGILQNNFTIRVHLDEVNENNGALKIVPGSHKKGIYRAETIDCATEKEVTCNVGKGGVMLMRPLLLHSSGRTTNHRSRRVIHIEFSKATLPAGIAWSEKFQF
jgi:ectoine hydroxylase-related dioxygenase (phytanoyl-CoA dioxygenase family)